MKQQSFTDMEYGGRRRVSKREHFLDIMEEIIPWDEWVSLVEPHCYCGKLLNPQPGDNNSERAGSDTSTSSLSGKETIQYMETTDMPGWRNGLKSGMTQRNSVSIFISTDAKVRFIGAD